MEISQAQSTDSFYVELSAAAEARAKSVVRYDGPYMKIPFLGGDVPAEMGVC